MLCVEGADDNSYEEVQEKEGTNYHEDNEENNPKGAWDVPWQVIYFCWASCKFHYVGPPWSGREHKQCYQGISSVVEVINAVYPLTPNVDAVPFRN